MVESADPLVVNVRRFLVFIAVPALVACSGMQQASDIAHEAAALQARFKTPMGVSLAKGWLVISVSSDIIAKTSSAQSRAFARQIARFAYDHYPHPKAIEQVGVQYLAGSRVTYLAGSWPASHLRDTASAPDTVPLGLAVRPFEDTLVETMNTDGRIDTLGTMVQSLRLMRAGPYAWWQQIVVFRASDGLDGVDSLRLDPQTLYPSVETRHNRRGFSRIIYDGPHVRGVLDSAATFTPLDTTLEVTPFASAEVDAVIRAQSLDTGFVTRVPLYYPGRIGFTWTTVRVVGIDSTAYLIDAVTARAGTDRYWISRSTRTLLAVQDMTDPAHSVSYHRR